MLQMPRVPGQRFPNQNARLPQGPWATPRPLGPIGPGFGNDMRVPGQPSGPSGPNAPIPNVQSPPFGQWFNNQVRPASQPSTQTQPQSLLGNVTSSITPMSVFTPQMTNTAANQAQAEYERAASPNYLLKQFDRPGVSRSAGSMSMAIPMMAALRGQGAQDAAGIRAQDELANRQSLLAGQVAQDREGLGLMQLLSMLQGVGRQNQMGDFNMGLGLLQGLL